MKYFGEQESQAESNAALAANMPLTFFLMFVTLLFLFKSYRKPIVILLMLLSSLSASYWACCYWARHSTSSLSWDYWG